MYKPVLYLNGAEIKNITSYNDLLSEQDGENSGRTPNLNMHRDILGRLLSITAKVEYLTFDEGKALLNILKNHSIQVKFLNSETGSYSTVSCYCVDPKKEQIPGGYFKLIEFTLNSNGRFD